MREIKEQNSNIDKLILRSYQFFEKGDFVDAQLLLDEAHALDFENLEVRAALRACGYWQQRMKSLEELEELSDNGPRGDYLRRQWRHFVDQYCAEFEYPFKEGKAYLQNWVHNLALDYYRKQSKESPNPEALLQSGRCNKVLGRFEECIAVLEEAIRLIGNTDSRLLAELADTYALIGESQPAKVLMREALYLDARRIDLGELIAPLFIRLIDRLEKEWDINDPAFPEWLAVYGTIWGVLDVSRELTPVEYGKLKQSIYALKNEISDGDKLGNLTPKLINRYLRLIDHYQSNGLDRSLIDEALINIKLLAPSIYRQYFE